MPPHRSSCVDVVECDQDHLLYRVTVPPEAMPPVRLRDLERAWDEARTASHARARAPARGFRFQGPDGRTADFDLTDRDARCWAGAVDRFAGLATLGGLSICLRLLALIDLMATSSWAAGFMTARRDGAKLHPALLRAAARADLTEEARFDAASLHHILTRRPQNGVSP